jgi:hypothetical protein
MQIQFNDPTQLSIYVYESFKNGKTKYANTEIAYNYLSEKYDPENSHPTLNFGQIFFEKVINIKPIKVSSQSESHHRRHYQGLQRIPIQ